MLMIEVKCGRIVCEYSVGECLDCEYRLVKCSNCECEEIADELIDGLCQNCYDELDECDCEDD